MICIADGWQLAAGAAETPASLLPASPTTPTTHPTDHPAKATAGNVGDGCSITGWAAALGSCGWSSSSSSRSSSSSSSVSNDRLCPLPSRERLAVGCWLESGSGKLQAAEWW